MKAVIYLDVDGVINAIRNGTPSQKRTGFKDFRRVIVRKYQIQYAQEVVDWLNRMGRREDVTIKWLTTWEEHAPRELAPALGIDGQQWEVLGGDLNDWGGAHWWKLQAIRNDYAREKPDVAIWIDDDIKREQPAINWATVTNGIIAVSPFEMDGLTQEDLNFIETQLGGEKQ